MGRVLAEIKTSQRLTILPQALSGKEKHAVTSTYCPLLPAEILNFSKPQVPLPDGECIHLKIK